MKKTELAGHPRLKKKKIPGELIAQERRKQTRMVI